MMKGEEEIIQGKDRREGGMWWDMDMIIRKGIMGNGGGVLGLK
jgi:hypothetical protein